MVFLPFPASSFPQFRHTLACPAPFIGPPPRPPLPSCHAYPPTHTVPLISPPLALSSPPCFLPPDSFHKPGFKQHAFILHHLFNVVTLVGGRGGGIE